METENNFYLGHWRIRRMCGGCGYISVVEFDLRKSPAEDDLGKEIESGKKTVCPECGEITCDIGIRARPIRVFVDGVDITWGYEVKVEDTVGFEHVLDHPLIFTPETLPPGCSDQRKGSCGPLPAKNSGESSTLGFGN